MISYLLVEILIGERFGIGMFRERSINIDLTFRCTLECPKCMRQSIREKGFKVPGVDISFDNLKKIAKYFKKLIFCGQISDPIFHPKFIEILKYCSDINIPVIINTAASQRPMKWYKKAFETYPKAEWLFGIDGLPEDSHKYRIHQDGKHLFEMMKLCAKMGLTARWQYIVFNYNENDIETCRKMARDNGIIFDVIYSGRWSLRDKYKPKNPNLYLNSKRDSFAINKAGTNEFIKGLKEIQW